MKCGHVSELSGQELNWLNKFAGSLKKLLLVRWLGKALFQLRKRYFHPRLNQPLFHPAIGQQLASGTQFALHQ
jgi:hypothetical protein